MVFCSLFYVQKMCFEVFIANGQTRTTDCVSHFGVEEFVDLDALYNFCLFPEPANSILRVKAQRLQRNKNGVRRVELLFATGLSPKSVSKDPYHNFAQRIVG